MTAEHLNRCKPKSLNVEIVAAERRLLLRRRQVTESNSRLLRHLHQRTTAPLTLLLAGGIGFMFAELTKSRTLHSYPKNQTAVVIKTTALNRAMDFMTLIQNLYTALPLILLFKSWFEANRSSEVTDYRHTTAAGNVAADGYPDKTNRNDRPGT